MKMKLANIALLGAALTSASVFADCDPSFYLGGEAQYNSFKYDDVLKGLTINRSNPISKKSAPGVGLFLGSRLHENFGVEAGISTSRAVKGSWNENATVNGVAVRNAGNIKMTNNNVYADLLGYLPVGCDVDLIGSVGIGFLSSKVDLNQTARASVPGRAVSLASTVTGTHSKAGVRVGAGVQYKFDENVGARLMVRYQKGNDFVKNNVQAGLGLFYQF